MDYRRESRCRRRCYDKFGFLILRLSVFSMINKNNNGRSKPFFHADHVGSFLRPGNLLEAWRRQENDEMTADEFRKEQNEAIREVVWLQEEVGLKAITDGEFRRDVWWSEFVAAIDGINVDRNDTSTPFQGNAVHPKANTHRGETSTPGRRHYGLCVRIPVRHHQRDSQDHTAGAQSLAPSVPG